MQKKKLIFIISTIIILITLIITSLIFLYPKKIKVPIATHTIKPWKKVIKEDIDYIYLSKNDLLDNIYLDEKDIIGKYINGKTTIYPNSYFFINSLMDEKDMSNGPYRYLNNNEVAYDLLVDEIKVNPSSIEEGMNIDLYLTIKNQDTILSDLLISNLHILGKYDKDGHLIKSKQDKVKSITVRLNRSDVSYINKALKLGDVSVVISSNVFENIDPYINKESEIFKYLTNETKDILAN